MYGPKKGNVREQTSLVSTFLLCGFRSQQIGAEEHGKVVAGPGECEGIGKEGDGAGRGDCSGVRPYYLQGQEWGMQWRSGGMQWRSFTYRPGGEKVGACGEGRERGRGSEGGEEERGWEERRESGCVR